MRISTYHHVCCVRDGQEGVSDALEGQKDGCELTPGSSARAASALDHQAIFPARIKLKGTLGSNLCPSSPPPVSPLTPSRF